MPAITVRPAQESDRESWLEMRILLWPDGTAEDYEPDITELLERRHAFVALKDGVAVGLPKCLCAPTPKVATPALWLFSKAGLCARATVDKV
jgi:hypothetical protein